MLVFFVALHCLCGGLTQYKRHTENESNFFAGSAASAVDSFLSCKCILRLPQCFLYSSDDWCRSCSLRLACAYGQMQNSSCDYLSLSKINISPISSNRVAKCLNITSFFLKYVLVILVLVSSLRLSPNNSTIKFD